MGVGVPGELRFLPELGDKQYTINQLAAIVGIAPYARDSGKKIGIRYIRGGRKIPRDALYIAVLSSRKWFSYLKQFYQRLIDKFKPKKVAIVACMRKLLEVAHKLVYHQRAFVSNSITT
jgi:transposase